MDSKDVKLEAWIRKSHNRAHAPYLFSYALATLWESGHIPGASQDVAIQVMHYNKVRIGLTRDVFKLFKEKFLVICDQIGLNCKEEATGEFLSANEFEGESTAASSCPSEWGSVKTVYLINVPPWWSPDSVTAMVGASKAKQSVAVGMRWSVGEIRTCTWRIQGREVDKRVGSIFRSTDRNDTITVISNQEYNMRKAGTEGQGERPQRPPDQGRDQSEPMESDHEMLQFFKRKREETTQ